MPPADILQRIVATRRQRAAWRVFGEAPLDVVSTVLKRKGT